MMYAVLLLALVATVLGFTSGPPVGSTYPNLCTDMIPTGHNGGMSRADDTDNPPYTITASADEYMRGSSLTVTITGTGGNQFEGFFIQARRADPARDNDVAIGTFSSPPATTQLLTCHNVENSAWGHSNSMTRSSIEATWTAPAQDEGPIKFMATIVKGVPDRDYFYLNVMSSQISFNATGGVTGAPTQQPVTPTSGVVTPTSGGPSHSRSVSVTLALVAALLASFLSIHKY
ncbi:putative ferric-chelate reductase 1 [Acanthaster planci]|uniref:Ferric-chelate reductase 1 n=1 Tax=Acanthaster planci TaxID=133434 RepID=A0A8B8A1T9_ACAPL|nr:putative ferric-chelate reductase 1 [Acanthaster planci]